MRRTRIIGFLALGLTTAIAGACAATSATNDFGGAGGDGSTSEGSGTTALSSSAAGLSGVGGSIFDGGPSGSGGGVEGPALIYAHTDTTLFKLDPTSPTLALTQIGSFDCVGGAGEDSSMTDLAVDKSQALWGVSAKYVYPLTVNGSTVHCGNKITLQNAKGVSFYGLTFAPAGVLDPAKEVLIAANTAGQLWAVDGMGNLSEHGTFGVVPTDDGNGHSYGKNAGKTWELSGDVVFLANNGSPVGFATARDCPTPPSTSNCNTVNTLIEIDVPMLAGATTQSVTKAVRGQIVKGATCQDNVQGDYGNMYGIAAWNDKVYGFSRTGNLVEINIDDGSACLAQAYPMDQFAGAGVTTLAPVQPPPPK